MPPSEKDGDANDDDHHGDHRDEDYRHRENLVLGYREKIRANAFRPDDEAGGMRRKGIKKR